MPTEPFARSSTTAAGVDPRGITRFLDAVQAAGIELHSLMVVRHGDVVAEGWWEPYSAERRHLVYSVSKTFTAAAVGCAVADGLLRLDAPVTSFFPSDVPDPVDPRVAALTVHHLLSMSTGHDEDVLDAMLAGDDRDWATIFLSTPPQTPVGSRHVYNNGCSNLLGTIVRSVTGKTLLDYLGPRLFEPLGIDTATWTTDRTGGELGWSGLHVTTEALAALGELYLHDGVWRGRRLLPEGWATASGREQVSTAYQDTIDWRFGYGYQMWVSRHGFRADGAFGQFVLVLPEHDAVLAITSGTSETQSLLDEVWAHLLPALTASPLPDDPDGERALAARLGVLSLPTAQGADISVTSLRSAGPVLAEEPADGEDKPWYPSLADAALTRTADGWSLSVLEDDQPLTVACGDGDWVVSTLEHPVGRSVPVAAAAGASSVAAQVDVVFVETPHRLRLELTAGPGGTTARMRWNVPPLHHETLADLSASAAGSTRLP
jgi:CubicO group peptidase (beta-lactamase class C family)